MFHPSKLINPKWAVSPGGRDRTANSINSLENESRPRVQGDQGRVTRLIGLHGPRPGLLGWEEELDPCQE